MQRSHTVRDYTITLAQVRDGVYSVTVYRGELRIENLTRSYPTEVSARCAARWVYKRLDLNLDPFEPPIPAAHLSCRVCGAGHDTWPTNDRLYNWRSEWCPDCHRVDLQLDATLDNN